MEQQNQRVQMEEYRIQEHSNLQYDISISIFDQRMYEYFFNLTMKASAPSSL